MREELIGGSAAWPDDYRVVKGWSGGTAILQDAMQESDEADGVSDRIDRRLAILGIGVGLAIVSAALVVITITKFAPGALEAPPIGDEGQAALASVSRQFHRWISPLAVVFGVLLYTLYPLGIALANDHADSGDFVAMSGGLLLSYSIGAMFGPIAASLLMQGLGPSGLFLFSAVVGGLLGLYSIWRMRIAHCTAGRAGAVPAGAFDLRRRLRYGSATGRGSIDPGTRRCPAWPVG